MSFTRTPSGLSNQHLFVGVDAIVFVERGNRSFTYKEIESNNFTSESIDILFWQKIFEFFTPRVKYQFRAVGSKTTLTEIASNVISGKIKNVLVAMDRDYDTIKISLLPKKGIFYTHGYSWENDVWDINTIIEVFYAICPVCRTTINIEPDIDYHLKLFLKNIKIAIAADLILTTFGKALFERKKPSSLLQFGSSFPKINMIKIKQKIRVEPLCSGLRATLKAILCRAIKIKPEIDCFGKCYSDFIYNLIGYLIKKYSRITTLPKYVVLPMAIEKFSQLILTPRVSSIYQHYNQQFALI
jgi:hypothetical protein